MVADDDNGAKARDFNLEIVFLPLIPTPPPPLPFFRSLGLQRFWPRAPRAEHLAC